MNARRGRSCQGTENTYLDAPENKLADASNGVIRKLEMACAGVASALCFTRVPRLSSCLCNVRFNSACLTWPSDMVEPWPLDASWQVRIRLRRSCSPGQMHEVGAKGEQSHPAPLND